MLLRSFFLCGGDIDFCFCLVCSLCQPLLLRQLCFGIALGLGLGLGPWLARGLGLGVGLAIV